MIKFQGFHKKVSAPSLDVVLGGNRGPGSGTRNNYSVILVKETNDAMVGEGGQPMATTTAEGKDEHLHEDDNMGLLLYDPRKPKMCVCVGEEDAWSKPVSRSVSSSFLVIYNASFAYVFVCTLYGGNTTA